MGKKPEIKAFLPWKNMQATIEIHCPCGSHIYIDRQDFAYRVVCLACGRIFTMPYQVPVEVAEPEDADYQDGALVWSDEQEADVREDAGFTEEIDKLIDLRKGR